jgi:integrase
MTAGSRDLIVMVDVPDARNSSESYRQREHGEQSPQAGVGPNREGDRHRTAGSRLRFERRAGRASKAGPAPARFARTPAPSAMRLPMAFASRSRPEYFTALSLGLRQGEILGLSWKDLDLEKKTIGVNKSLQRVDGVLTLVEPKTEKSRRTLIIPDTLAKLLKQRGSAQLEERLAAGAEWHDSGLVFTTRHGKPLDGLNVTRNFTVKIGAGDRT